MANDVTICITGNLVNDPILRFAPSGAAVANFTIASTPRAFDKTSNEWKDGEAMFLTCSAWRQLGRERCGDVEREGHARHRARPVEAAQLRDQGW